MQRLNIRYQKGQSMVEYVVVVFFSVLLLSAPLFDPNGDDDTFESFDYAREQNSAGRNLNAIQAVQAVMRDNYKGYSYAVSLSEYPDYLPLSEQRRQLQNLNEQLNVVNDEAENAVSYIEDNLPPSLDSVNLPSAFPSFP